MRVGKIRLRTSVCCDSVTGTRRIWKNANILERLRVGKACQGNLMSNSVEVEFIHVQHNARASNSPELSTSKMIVTIQREAITFTDVEECFMWRSSSRFDT